MIGWLVDERGIEPHVKLMDKAERTDGLDSGAKRNGFKRSGFERPFQARQSRLGRAS
jgi:hypothetical protein